MRRLTSFDVDQCRDILIQFWFLLIVYSVVIRQISLVFSPSILAKIKIIKAFFVITLFAQLNVRIGISLTCGNHLHDLIISRRLSCGPETILIPPLFTAVSVPSQKCERSSIFSWVVSVMFPLFLLFSIIIWNCSDFLVFFLSFK